MLNHVPVLGTIFGLALLAFALVRKDQGAAKTALGVFVIAALLAVPVYLTGEPSEEVVESLPGVSESFIERHEEAAGAALAGIVLLGLGAVAGLLRYRRETAVPAWFTSVMLTASLVAGGLMLRTANLGGQIRHSEIRADSSPPAARGEREHH
jgi:DMSO reductase anchor subunit